ncbi:MAG TPA: TonB-dependent receptor [Thermoanaerobaculia bacterium]|jgi:iron complex outermembrane receptor protein|nr:TonB-dependent receptor [Thermoanaerobaculia bacterium]
MIRNLARARRLIGLLAGGLVVFAAATLGQTGSIAGRVVTAEGNPAPDARVELLELRRQSAVDADGRFRFDAIPVGSYLLQATSPRFGDSVARVVVPAGAQPDVTLTLERAVHREQVVVSASAEARRPEEVVQPVEVLSDQELQEQTSMTIGDTLSSQPGITATTFGPGASRPVIRGLGGDRIRMLENGIGVGDASSTSPDHAVSTEVLGADRIEVIRGPATLLYGSSAIGGVVNVIDDRIPDHLPAAPVTGMVELRGATNADERGGAASVTGGLGPVAWHVGGSKRKTDDYEIPGFARVEPEPGDEKGVVKNTFIDSDSLTGGLSFVGNAGFLGASYSGFNTDYGSAAEEEVHIEMKQRRFDVRGEITQPFAFLRGLKARFGSTDYEHTEFEGEETGTVFTNDSWEARLEAPQRAVGILEGAFGFQIGSKDFEAIGEEAFLPKTTTDNWAVFAVEEFALTNAFRMQVGGRYENQDVSADFTNFPTEGPIDDRSFNSLSGSLGFVWTVAPNTALALSVSRSVKLPNAEELFANGPHIATNAFEIGDPTLNKEKSWGSDLSLRQTAGRVTGSITVFANRFDGFIFEQLTDEVEDELQVIRFTQRDAEFVGGELHTDIELLHAHPHHLSLELTADYVRAKLRDTDEPLPRIPPFRFGGAIRYQGEAFWGLVGVRHARKQDRISEFETETDGFTLLEAAVGYRFFFGGVVNDVILRGTNLTDEEARNHVSFLKDVAPMPGRDVSLSYRVSF